MTGNALVVKVSRKTYAARTPGASHTALAGLEFSIPEGQFACMLGPSGCGKTTLLNIVSGLDTEVEGAVTFGDQPLGQQAIGYMFQTPRLFPWLTVRDNVRMVLRDHSDATGRAEQLLKEMHLEEVMDAFPNRLSGGMQRRVALARAFAASPRLLLMDEPFVSLEAPVANQLRRLLLDIWGGRPTTVLFVTHDLREALCLADRVLFLSPSPGRVVLDLPVTLGRPRDPDDPAIDRLQRDLLGRYPDLLAGLVGVAPEKA
ncbi:MAG: ABC transporter ATP-binding protein [Alphaproteobacteria bacterium]